MLSAAITWPNPYIPPVGPYRPDTTWRADDPTRSRYGIYNDNLELGRCSGCSLAGAWTAEHPGTVVFGLTVVGAVLGGFLTRNSSVVFGGLAGLLVGSWAGAKINEGASKSA